jgi:hypothetical protein
MITPITWNGAPDMDIEFYGLNTNKLDGIDSVDIKTTPKTITYSIELPSNHQYKVKIWSYADRRCNIGYRSKQTSIEYRSEMARTIKSIKKGISTDKVHDFAQTRRGYEGHCHPSGLVSIRLYDLELDTIEKMTVNINGNARCIINYLNKKYGNGMYSAYFGGMRVYSSTLIENLLDDDIIVVV